MASNRKAESLLSDDSLESEGELRINKEYARKYDKWREKEEMQKLKDRYGEKILEKSLSSSSESSDSEEESELNHAIGKDFLKTISLLKRKDPVIYNKDICFFPTEEENDDDTRPKKIKKEKPMFWKDQERQVLVEKQGVFSDDEVERPKASYLLDSTQYEKEKEHIKQSFAVASDSDEDLLTERIVNKKEKDLEEDEYIEWLKGEKEKLIKDAELKNDLTFLQHYWKNSNLDSDEAFLRDFILNKRYIEQKESKEVPTYNEIGTDEENLSEDEKILDQQEVFEHKYNFRFEEPDPEFIKQFPRTLKDSLRRNDSKRKCKREEIRERKKQEKEKKKEEIKRLKALKRKEIEEKLDQLKEITGNDKIAFDDLDLEGDFDPDKYDEKMKEMFNEEYYEVEEGVQKPMFPPDEELDENWDNWTRKKFEDNNDGEQNMPNEESNFIMDADYNLKEEFQKSIIESTRRNKNKKKSKLAEILSKKKPLFNPELESFEKYIDEYYKLDCEDIIDDMPVRFSYRKVIPNEFGLSVDEILYADDKQLNRWCSLKKTCQYRTTEEELYDVQAFKKKANNIAAKKKILYNLYSNEDEKQNVPNEQKNVFETTDFENLPKKNNLSDHAITSKHKTSNCRKKKRKHKREDTQQVVTEQTVVNTKQNGSSPQIDKKHQLSSKKHKSNANFQKTDSNSKSFEMSDDRLKAYGINPKKFKNKLKWQKNNNNQ